MQYELTAAGQKNVPVSYKMKAEFKSSCLQPLGTTFWTQNRKCHLGRHQRAPSIKQGICKECQLSICYRHWQTAAIRIKKVTLKYRHYVHTQNLPLYQLIRRIGHTSQYSELSKQMLWKEMQSAGEDIAVCLLHLQSESAQISAPLPTRVTYNSAEVQDRLIVNQATLVHTLNSMQGKQYQQGLLVNQQQSRSNKWQCVTRSPQAHHMTSMQVRQYQQVYSLIRNRDGPAFQVAVH